MAAGAEEQLRDAAREYVLMANDPGMGRVELWR